MRTDYPGQPYEHRGSQVTGDGPFQISDSRDSFGFSQRHFRISAAITSSPHRPRRASGGLWNRDSLVRAKTLQGMALRWGSNNMDVKEKLKRERDELQGLPLGRTACSPTPLIRLNKSPQSRRQGSTMKRSRGGPRSEARLWIHNGLIVKGKIQSDQAQQLLYLLDVRSKALMKRIGERMADTFGTDPNVLITAGDDEE